MNSYGEIRTCLVLAFSAMLIIKTRARFIYHPDPLLHCMQAKVPCSGHPTESSCNEYCIANGFPYGSCSSSCCLCHNGVQAQGHHHHPLQQLQLTPMLESQQSLMSKIQMTVSESQSQSSPVSSDKPKRHVNHLESINNNEITDEITSSVCLTPECVKSANALLVNMDENVNPCDDFYQFACGNFEASTVIPDDKSEVTLIGSLTDKLHQQIRLILEDKEIAKEKESAQLAKKLYASCSDKVSLEANGIQPLLSLLESQAGWPVLQGITWADSPMNENWSWPEASLRLSKVGISAGYLLGIGVGPDIKNPGKRIITIGEPSLGLSKEQLPNQKFIRDYHKYQIDLAVFLGANRDLAVKELGEVLEFEKALAHIALPREAARGHPLMFYNPMTIADLHQRFPGVNWLDFIQRSLPESVTVGEDEVVIVSVPHHLTNLLNLMKNTDTRILANYLLWRASSSVIPYLSDSARDVQFQFTSKVSGQSEKPPKWRECVGLTTSTLAHAVGSLYVKQYFNEDARTQAIKMFQDIHDSFISLLTEADWMDPDTKQKAFEKAQLMRSHIAYPEELLQEENLLSIYNGLELSETNFLGNILNITKSAKNFGMRKLRQPIDRNDWIPNGKPAVINAFYNPLHNSIQFPAGILQGQFFNSERSHVLNYGAIGWVYGHELTHGFDDQGSHFDLNGDVKDWWHPHTKQQYHDKTKCIVNQYGEFSFSDLVTNNTAIHLNGIISQGENIADNGGIKLAYRGYQLWVKKNGQEKRLPGLQQYTSNQLFWLSAANNWCSKHRPEALVHSLKTRIHPPGKFRVLGSFQNSKQFSKDFNCPVGSKMNPKDKCTVW